MGLTYATLKLTNLLGRQSVEVNALVDTGATFMCVPEEVALQLGFDITEVSQQVVTLADGHQRKVPKWHGKDSTHGNEFSMPVSPYPTFPRKLEKGQTNRYANCIKIAPIEIMFGNRSYVTEAVVLGNESLLGVIPMEAMDLVVDPRQQILIANPQHPNYPVALAK